MIGSTRVCACILFMIGSTNALSDEEVLGQITYTDGDTFIQRGTEDCRNMNITGTDMCEVSVPEGTVAKDTLDGDTLISEFDGNITVDIENVVGDVIVGGGENGGKLKLTGPVEEPRCHVIGGVVQFREGEDKAEGVHNCCKVLTDDADAECDGTAFEVHADAYDTYFIVHEGRVDVTSKGVDNPETVPVHAGYWVKARYGEQISEVHRFSWAVGENELVSGSTRCIHSSCSIIDDPVIPNQPDFLPKIFGPPPPNPPGRR